MDLEGLLVQRRSFFSHSLNKSTIMKAPPSNIRMILFQGIRQFSVSSILKESITKYPLSIYFVHTIWRGKMYLVYNISETLEESKNIIICEMINLYPYLQDQAQ